jgi:glycosyltransferase involved in cell wall biosynthesis
MNNIPVVCINLKSREDKRKIVISHLKKFNIKFNFYTAILNKNPKLGCKLSHLEVIKNAINREYKQILIVEDDVKFITRPNIDISALPSNWDMCYLGGTVYRVLDKNNPNWYRVQCWTTHAYIINLENKKLIDEINKSVDTEDEIDKFYLLKIHPYFNCYMMNPMCAIQRDGESDIEGRYVNYDFMTKTLDGLQLPEYEVDNDQNYILKLPDIPVDDLPKVSIITPTYNRRKMFNMAIRNFENFDYPRNKMEWIIVDDTPDNLDTIEDILPREYSKQIKYIKLESKLKSKLTVAHKRNIGVSNSSHDYIIHMDDDDYYPPESIICRIKLLMKYKSQNIECLGSTLIGTYDIINNISSMSSDSPISLSEASMAYTKKFWEERQFDNECMRGEHKQFTEGRLNRIMDVPYIFIIIAINHKNNMTKELRNNVSKDMTNNYLRYSNTDKIANYYDMWDIETQCFINELRNYIK